MKRPLPDPVRAAIAQARLFLANSRAKNDTPRKKDRP